MTRCDGGSGESSPVRFTTGQETTESPPHTPLPLLHVTPTRSEVVVYVASPVPEVVLSSVGHVVLGPGGLQTPIPGSRHRESRS